MNEKRKVITETAIGIDPYGKSEKGEISRFSFKDIQTGKTTYGNLEWKDGTVDSEVVFRESEARFKFNFKK